MMAMCLKYAKDEDEAMMVVNNGFLKVFKNIESFKFQGSFEGWIRKIVYRSICDHYKKENKRIKFLVLEDFNTGYNQNVVEKLYEEDILRLIEKVPNASADIFVLFAIHGYSHKEISEMRSISIGTSKWHLSNARKKLQELILSQNAKINYAQ